MSIDVVQVVKDGGGQFEWVDITREYQGYKLHIPVMRDAMKFDDVPELIYNRRAMPAHRATGKVLNGVRLPASALELQQIADLVDGMLMTPLVIEEIWLQAELKFDAVLNDGKGGIVATMDIHELHGYIEAELEKLGGDDGECLISCVGKYWCLINALTNRKAEGTFGACNFGWCRKRASGPGVTQRVQCYQRPGFRHSYHHLDPSQTIRLMARFGRLIHPASGIDEPIDLRIVAADPKLAGLLHHNPGTLNYLRQEGVEELSPRGIITLPEVTITGDVS